MIGRQELYDCDCVAGLIHVIEQAPLRAAARRLRVVNRSSASLLLLWSLLRWERTFLIRTLERMGIDLWQLACDVDEALKPGSKHTQDADGETGSNDLDPLLRDWLRQAAVEARALQHDFLSDEHLLLALLADGDPRLAAIFQRNGLTHDALKQAVADALSQAATADIIVLDEVASSLAEQPVRHFAEDQRPSGKTEGPGWVGDIDRPAVGVPRRFGVFIMMLMVTLYAVLFSILKLLRASNVVFVLLALLFTGIGIGQAVLFGGRYPRSASIWIGSILVPIEVCVFATIKNDFLYVGPSHGAGTVIYLLAIFLVSIPLGAIFGYLFGTLTAGGFYLVDRYEKRRESDKGPHDK